MKALRSSRQPAPSGRIEPELRFDGLIPVAVRGLGGLVRDQFGHGRTFATVSPTGGLVNVSHWGNQHLGAASFFQAGLETAWYKLFRPYVNIDGKRYYPTLHQTRLHPFGYESHDQQAGVTLQHDLLLLPDALVQRIKVGKTSLPVRFGMLHMEGITAVNRANRTWSDLVFDQKLNSLITSCVDVNPPPAAGGEESLAQKGLGTTQPDAPQTTTWIGLGCDLPLTTHRGYHARSKHYILSGTLKKQRGAFFVVFASSRPELESRLRELSGSVHRECDKLLADYQSRLLTRPRIDVGDAVLNSAFGQFPEVIEKMKLPDKPGASRATLAGYFVWGWDGMTPLLSSPLANEAGYSASVLRFFQKHLDPQFGLPHQFTTAFTLRLKGPFASQCQYICGLYHYASITGDLSLAREVLPTCEFILDRCRRDIVQDTGLVSGAALWPDFPEAMEENGNDISSMNNSLLYQGLRAMEFLAARLDRPELARECAEWAQRLRTHFIKYLYDEEKGFFISSCSSIDLRPRQHYCAQAIYWLTPFARELVSHAPARISSFMDQHLRSSKCLLTLPHWDKAWMADGNQLGSSFPAADNFYLGVHKIAGHDDGLKAWLGDVKWFWKHHTAPEAFTPEAENEEAFGPDSWGGKQAQACTTWYAGVFTGLAGLDFDYEGLTLTPWGDRPLEIKGLKLRGVSVDLKIRGSGTSIGSLTLNGARLPAGTRKIAWNKFKGKTARLELVRTKKVPTHPVVLRADGLRITSLESKPGQLSLRINGDMTGEIVIQTKRSAHIFVDGKPSQLPFDKTAGTVTVPFPNLGALHLELTQ